MMKRMNLKEIKVDLQNGKPSGVFLSDRTSFSDKINTAELFNKKHKLL